MDDISMLLPGLKVSSGLIRQRPLSPNAEDRCERTTVGSKRRYNEQCQKVDAGPTESDVSSSKRQQGSGFRRLPRRLRLEPTSSPSPVLEANPAFEGLQAGITSTMVNDLDESPKLPGSCTSPGTDADFCHSNILTQKASADMHERLRLMASTEDIGACSLQAFSAPATCPSVLPPTPAGSSSEASGALCSELFQKSKSAPSRIENLGVCISGRPSQKALSHPSTSETSSGHEVTSAVSSPPTPRNNLSRAEKWHERINAATLRLRLRSLPVTPPRTRVEASAAQ